MTSEELRARFGVAAHAHLRPDAIAVVAGERRISYRQLDDRIARAANALGALGIERRSRVLVALRNRPEMLEVAMGAARLRAEVVPAAWRSTADELAYLAADAGAAVAIVEPEGRAAAEGLGIPVLVVGDDYDAALARQSTEPIDGAGLDYVHLHSYTSGTTGRPKAIQLPGFNPKHALLHAREYQARWGLDEPDLVNLAVSPMHHLAGWSYPHSALVFGHTTVLMDGFDAEQVLALIERERVTYLNLVPYHFLRIAQLDDDVRRRYDLSSVRIVLHGSAPCPPDLKWQMVELFPPDTIWETYGGSEGLASVISPAEWREHPGSVGRPVEELQVLGDDGMPCAAGEPGLIYVAPRAGVRFEYRGDPEQSAAIWRGDLFTLGDIGYLDADGYLYLVDRAKDMIVSGGANVYPAEVEAVLREHPAVAEVAVIGVPDDTWGERVHAVVVPGMPVTESDLLVVCRERLVRAKCPSSVELVDDLPRDPVGKVRKRDLRDRYWRDEERRI
jgi:long-chain acyl-CoA synthetase